MFSPAASFVVIFGSVHMLASQSVTSIITFSLFASVSHFLKLSMATSIASHIAVPLSPGIS